MNIINKVLALLHDSVVAVHTASRNFRSPHQEVPQYMYFLISDGTGSKRPPVHIVQEQFPEKQSKGVPGF